MTLTPADAARLAAIQEHWIEAKSEDGFHYWPHRSGQDDVAFLLAELARLRAPTGDAMEARLDAKQLSALRDDIDAQLELLRLNKLLQEECNCDRYTCFRCQQIDKIVSFYKGDSVAEKKKWLASKIGPLAAAITAAEARTRQAERLRDDPEADGTDLAHPAWWRGHDHTFAIMCAMATKILDGEEPTGTSNEPWETLRRRLWELRRDHQAGVRDGIEMAAQWHKEQDRRLVRHTHFECEKAIRALAPAAPEGGE